MIGVLGVVVTASSGEQGRTIVLFPSALLLIGIIVVTPALSGPAIALAGPLLRRFGVPGTLAPPRTEHGHRQGCSRWAADDGADAVHSRWPWGMVPPGRSLRARKGRLPGAAASSA
ncbi:hypothetical protein PV367_41210, partial [Streptomyces europaeiscabiei]